MDECQIRVLCCHCGAAWSLPEVRISRIAPMRYEIRIGYCEECFHGMCEEFNRLFPDDSREWREGGKS